MVDLYTTFTYTTKKLALFVVYLGQIREATNTRKGQGMARLTGKGSREFYNYALRQMQDGLEGDSYMVSVKIAEQIQAKGRLYPNAYHFYINATDKQWKVAIDKAIEKGRL